MKIFLEEAFFFQERKDLTGQLLTLQSPSGSPCQLLQFLVTDTENGTGGIIMVTFQGGLYAQGSKRFNHWIHSTEMSPQIKTSILAKLF